MLTTKCCQVRLWREILPSSPHRNQPPQPQGETAIGTVAHHQERSQYFFRRAAYYLAHLENGLACIALQRAASHAAAAAAVHWGFPHSNRRRLISAVMNVMSIKNRSWAPHLRTMRRLNAITPEWINSVDPRVADATALRLYRRVQRLIADIDDAITANPSPRTVQQAMSQLPTEIPAPVPP